MIRYALKCRNNHSFVSWFQSAEAFDGLKTAGMVACPECNDTAVEKSLMAPQVSPARGKTVAEHAQSPQPMASTSDPKIAEAIKAIREHVEKTSDYVGERFASEARAMHDGDMPHRSIYGEVKPDEAKKLAEDGVPAVPLPFVPRQKTN